MGGESRINDEFPIGESLSPPFVSSPIYECAEAVHVSGFVPHATVRVWAAGSELLADDAPVFGFADMPLKRALKVGESITATQTVNSIDSAQSPIPVIVQPLDEGLVKTKKPDVGDDLYECGIVVPVGNLVPSVRVHVTEDGNLVGNMPVAKEWHPVITSPLHAGGSVEAQQFACEGTDHEIQGMMSDPVAAKAAPVPTPPPGVDAASLIVGNDTVTLTKLLVGAGARITDRGNVVSSGWFATGPANWFPIDTPLEAASEIQAVQELCGNVSDPSDPVKPEGELQRPIVVGPICEGTQFVIVRDTTINANVVVLRNGNPAAYGGAGPGDVILALGSNATLSAGDTITAIQYVGSTFSQTSAPVTVSSSIPAPVIEIHGGHPFFFAKAGEQAIDGPVFPRGAGSGPSIRVQSCCEKTPEIEVLDPDGNHLDTLAASPLFPGYDVATWGWTKDGSLIATGDLPVGRYTVIARSECDQEEGRATFYVIFDPAEVNGPPRFSFDPTAVWFGTGYNSISGLHYYLHESDIRVFSIAINAVNGMTDAYAAAEKVARAEEALFSYSLNYHTQDVVQLITTFNEAQCADDAACLTALLRSVGIPAHPVTADAGLETDVAGWTFDTWIEFLTTHNGSTDWLIFHPHQYPGMTAEDRSTFGSTRGVAVESTNDVIVMANESWVMADLDDSTSDVTYGRNSCGEPNQVISTASWVDELCEQGYWAPSHWDCAGMAPMSARIGEIYIEERPSFGAVVRGRIRLPARGRDEKEREAPVRIELIAHRREGKSFVDDERVVEGRARIGRVRGRREIPFELDVPRRLPPGRDLYVRVLAGDRQVGLRPIELPALLDARLDVPRRIQVGEEFEIRATITNRSAESIDWAEAELMVPWAIVVDGEAQRIDELRSHGRRVVTWRAHAVAEIPSGVIWLAVAAALGSGADVREHVEVTEVARPRSTAVRLD